MYSKFFLVVAIFAIGMPCVCAQDIQDLERQHDATAQDIKKLEDAISDLEQKAADLADLLSASKKEVEKFQKAVDALEGIETRSATESEVLGGLKVRLDIAKEDLETAQKAYNLHCTQLADANAALAEKRAKYSKTRENLTFEYLRSSHGRSKEVKEVKDQVASLQATVEQLREEVVKKEEFSRFTEETAKNFQKLEDGQKAISNKIDALAAALQQHREALKKDLDMRFNNINEEQARALAACLSIKERKLQEASDGKVFLSIQQNMERTLDATYARWHPPFPRTIVVHEPRRSYMWECDRYCRWHFAPL